MTIQALAKSFRAVWSSHKILGVIRGHGCLHGRFNPPETSSVPGSCENVVSIEVARVA